MYADTDNCAMCMYLDSSGVDPMALRSLNILRGYGGGGGGGGGEWGVYDPAEP